MFINLGTLLFSGLRKIEPTLNGTFSLCHVIVSSKPISSLNCKGIESVHLFFYLFKRNFSISGYKKSRNTLNLLGYCFFDSGALRA